MLVSQFFGFLHPPDSPLSQVHLGSGLDHDHTLDAFHFIGTHHLLIRAPLPPPTALSALCSLPGSKSMIKGYAHSLADILASFAHFPSLFGRPEFLPVCVNTDHPLAPSA